MAFGQQLIIYLAGLRMSRADIFVVQDQRGDFITAPDHRRHGLNQASWVSSSDEQVLRGDNHQVCVSGRKLFGFVVDLEPEARKFVRRDSGAAERADLEAMLLRPSGKFGGVRVGRNSELQRVFDRHLAQSGRTRNLH